MKNIKPNTKYYITFKEKTELTEVTNPAHGLYLKPDTASTVSDVTDAAQVTHAALTRNNGNIGIHQEACADTDWEERTIEWTSGSGIDTDKFPGDDVLAAKLEFTFMSALGTVQIKDLELFEESVYIPQGNISVSAYGTNVSGVYNINYRGADEKFAAYLAAYDEDGRLLKLVSRDADEGRTEFSMDTDGLEVDTVKAFLWNGEQNSVCDAVTVE